MAGDNQEVIYCEDDGEYRVYCNICDKLCIERFCKNHPKSGTHFTNIRKDSNFISNNLLQTDINYYCSSCEKNN